MIHTHDLAQCLACTKCLEVGKKRTWLEIIFCSLQGPLPEENEISLRAQVTPALQSDGTCALSQRKADLCVPLTSALLILSCRPGNVRKQK